MAVDAEAAVRDWVNARTDLSGLGSPLPLGAHLGRLRSPANGAYALLLRVGGTRALTAERHFDRARISATVYAATKEAACIAATAYCTALEQLLLGGALTPMGESVVCQAVDAVNGPLGLDDTETDHEQYRYVVDADFFLILASALQ